MHCILHLFTNTHRWDSVNEIEEPDKESGYIPKMVNQDFLGKSFPFRFTGAVKVYGAYVSSEHGDFVFSQKFDQPIEVSNKGGIVQVQFLPPG
jgi:hypothetical protein